jgi:deoxyribodipyrimidine photo-lyase
VKQAKDQDPEGHFVRKWIPALKNVPCTWIFEPWLMTPELQIQYQCIIGQDYPAPMLKIESALKLARAKITQARRGAKHTDETQRIIEKHASRKGRAAKKSKLNKVSEQPAQAELGVQQVLF